VSGPPKQVPATVLVVDDDESIRNLLSRYLSLEGYEVVVAADAPSALVTLDHRPPDIVLLDVMLAAHDGLDVLTKLRRSSDLPVILLTARSSETDRVMGLRLGADDYVVKPFSPAELSARISSVLRRSRPSEPRTWLEFDGLRVDLARREVLVGGEPVATTAKEFDLLAFLAASPGQVFTRDQLLEQVWDSSSAWQDTDTVTEHIRRLRRRIETDPENPRWLRTVRGVGYRFDS
jgi:DNA-binding response OmpR family regulator